MKRYLHRSVGHRKIRAGVPLTAMFLLLATSPLRAAASTAFQGTGHLVDVPVPGILVTNDLGQVLLKGNLHVQRVQADDARATGRLQACMDLAYQADGTAIFGGLACQQVGTWNLEDPLNPRFSPTGGVWDLNYRGVAQTDGSQQVSLTGYGIGGAIDGQRLEETVTREPGGLFDPAIPYFGTGRIQTAPVNTREVIESFDGPRPTRWTLWSSNDRGVLTQTNGQFTVRGYWPGVHTTSPYDSWAKGWTTTKPWTIADGQTLEWRVDLVRRSESASIVDPIVVSQARGLGYSIAVGHDFVAIAKWVGAWAVLSCEKATVGGTNLVLALALTRVQTNLVITARVVGNHGQGDVLFQRSVVDTPLADPSLTTAQFEAVTGIGLGWSKDQKGTPVFEGDRLDLEIFQNNDGTKPEATATFDNLELRRYEIPSIGVERAVRLTWPESAVADFGVEFAPKAIGPWLPLNNPTWPGLKQLTVPATSDMQFFRLREMP